MNVVYTIEALTELRAARQWYERRAPGLGERFVNLVDEKLGEIARGPGSFPLDPQDPVVRRARMPKYPYTLLFMVHEGVVVLVAVAHGKRKPGYWRNRLRLQHEREARKRIKALGLFSRSDEPLRLREPRRDRRAARISRRDESWARQRQRRNRRDVHVS